MVIVDIVMFTIVLCFGGITYYGEFLQPTTKALLDFGAKYPCYIRYDYQI